MENEDEILRAAWVPTQACLELPLLLDRVEMGDATVKAHVDHCPRCAAEVALYRDVTGAPPPPDLNLRAFDQRVRNAIHRAGTKPPAESWWKRLLRPMVLTPALAALAMLVIMVATRLPQRTPAISSENVDRAHAVELLSPKGEVAGAPEVFRWSAVAGATSYRIRILEVDRNIMWEQTIKVTSASVPQQVQKQVLPGKRLIWSVEAFNNKQEIVASGSQDFRRSVVRTGVK